METSCVQDTDNNLNIYFKQDSEFLNCLQPLLKSLGWTGKYHHLVHALPHFSDFLDVTSFRNVMAKLQYKSEPIKTSLHLLDEKYLPGFFIPDKHESFVIESKKDGKYQVYKSLKQRHETIDSTNMPGTFYLFSKIETKDKSINGKKNWFQQSIYRFKNLIAQVFLISLLLNVFFLATPLFIMNIYDKVTPTGSVPMLINFTIGVLIILIGTMLLHTLRTKIIAYIGARLDITVGDTILERILYLAPGFTETASVGAQVARIKDFDNVREFFTSPVINIFFELPFTIIFLGVIWYLGGWIILVPIFMLLVFSLIFLMFHVKLSKSIKRSSVANSIRQSFQIEAIDNMRTIKALGAEQTWSLRYKELTTKSTLLEFNASIWTSSLHILSDSIMMLSGLCVVCFGVLQVFNGTMTVGGLIATMMLVWRILSPFKTFFTILPKFTQITSSIKQINSLMSIPIEKDPDKAVNNIPIHNGGVEFNRVSFRYRNDMNPSLLGISFIANPGELICVTGPNKLHKGQRAS